MTARDRDGLAGHARLATPAFAALALLGALGVEMPLGAQLSFAFMLALVVGLPHGAIDHETAATRWAPVLGRAYLPLFVLSYVAVAGAVLGAWIAAPLASLIAFLALSALHFGLSDAEISGGRPVRSLARVGARGLLPITLPGILHAEEIAPVFEALLLGRAEVSAEAVQGLSLLLGSAALVAAFGTLEPGWKRDGETPLRLAALASLVGCLLFAPPLLGFALYFCGWHALREVLDLASTRPGSSLGARIAHFMRAAWPFSLLAALAFAAALGVASSPGSWTGEARVLFIGLASLTVPHMLVEGVAALSSRSTQAGRLPASSSQGQFPARLCGKGHSEKPSPG